MAHKRLYLIAKLLNKGVRLINSISLQKPRDPKAIGLENKNANCKKIIIKKPFLVVWSSCKTSHVSACKPSCGNQQSKTGGKKLFKRFHEPIRSLHLTSRFRIAFKVLWKNFKSRSSFRPYSGCMVNPMGL